MKTQNKCLTVVTLTSITIILLTSCTKLKDKDYGELVSSQFVPTEGDIGSLVGSAYGNWRELYNNTGWYYTQEITADAVVIPARPNGWTDGGLFRRPHLHQWTTEDDYAADDWTKAYAGVTNANRIIYQLETNKIPVQESDRPSLIAELRALRASYYYALCDIFGNVPIITKFDVPEGYLPEQNTRTEVYNFIVTELKESLPLLSTAADQTTYGRFNRWAAFALLAKMYLNAEVYTGTPAWDDCIAVCDSIINSGNYQLESNHREVFKTENQGSKEIIFAIPFDEKYAGGFWMHLQTLHPSNQQTYNIETFPWGGDCAIPQFIDTYDPEDSRFQDDWLKGQQYSSSGEPLTGTMDQQGKPLVYVNDVPSVDSSTEFSGYREGKYEFKLGLQFNMSNDVPLFRYSDILMMKAECLLRKGDANGAADIVSEVRARNFKDNPAKAVVTGGDLMAGSVYKYGQKDSKYGWYSNEGGSDILYGRFLDELGWEFAQEGRRRQDLIRFGVFTKKSWLSHKPNGDYRILFPIPQREINKNSNLTQNPGY